jgi:methyl-accepting chemotaxis protein
MADDFDSFDNQALAIRRFVKGYHKGIVLNTVTLNSLDIIGHNMDRIGDNLSAIVSAFEEIRATSQTTAGNTDRIDSMMDGILTKNGVTGDGISERVSDVDRAADGASRLSTLFAQLTQKASSIASATEEIKDVSDRTNILAINASIEAARAGAVGKGFRIIANEVRSLAGQTGDFAKSIESTIDDFQGVVGDISTELDGFTKMLSAFRESFRQILDSYRDNAGAIDEAGTLLGQISGSIHEETSALTDGLSSLEAISTSLTDTRVVFGALIKTYGNLDHILDKEGGR